MTIAHNQKGEAPGGLHPLWICGVVVAGMALFVVLSLLLVQRLRGPVPPVAKRNVSPQPNGATQAPSTTPFQNNNSGLTGSNDATKAWAPVGGAANRNRAVFKAGLPPRPSSSRTQPVTQPVNSTTKPIAQNSSLPRVEADPFAKLPRDNKDHRLAVLALPDPTESSKPVVWDLALQNADDFEITLVGSEVLLSKKLAEVEIVRKEGCDASGKRIWSLQSRNNLDSSEDPLGEFHLSVEKDSSQLSFFWKPDGIRRLEAGLVRWLAIGLSAGPSKILCRLSQVRPIPRLACKFRDDKDYQAAPSFELRSPLLADRMNSSGSGLLMQISLPIEFRTDKTYDSSKLTRLPIDTKSVFTIPLAVIPDAASARDLELFRKDEPLASVTLRPSIAGKSFALEITATTSIPIYDLDQVVKLRKAALELGEFTAPKAVAYGLSSAQPVGQHLNADTASRVTNLIRDTIKKLEHESLRRDGAINQVKRKINAASSIEEEALEKMLDSLSKKQVTLKKTIESLTPELARHDVRRLGMLKSLLLGNGDAGVEDKSIRGTIHSATIGVTIGYECEFNGERYFMIIEEASE